MDTHQTPAVKPHSVHQLRVYHSALELTEQVYRITRSMPAEERYGITAQVRRAAVSVVANIAEGRARFGLRTLAAYLDVAHGSVREVQALLLVASRLEMLPAVEQQRVDELASAVAAQLLSLVQWVRKRTGARGNH